MPNRGDGQPYSCSASGGLSVRRKWKWVAALLAVCVLVAVAARVGWRARPLPTVREYKTIGTHRVVEVQSRTHRLLPVWEWGAGSWRCIGCGSKCTVSTT